MKRNTLIVKSILLLLLVVSCDNLIHNNSAEHPHAPHGEFNYQTVKEVELHVVTHTGGVAVGFYNNETLLFTGISNVKGEIKTPLQIGTYITALTLRTGQIGFLQEVTVPITDEVLYFDYKSSPEDTASKSAGTFDYQDAGAYNTLGSWNANGFPQYIDGKESIESDFFTRINNALPEKQPVPEYNPHYLYDTSVTDLHLLEEADVYVTFIHEGAGYKNVLGFFTYNTLEGPPGSVNPEDITVIFPNVSYLGGGGELESGHRVNIGRFLGGTSIAWVLLANGYSSKTARVTSGLNTFYSVDDLNPDGDSYKQHVVQIDFGDRVVLAFEDLLRPYGDNDFNDAVFTVTSNPPEAVDSSNIVPEGAEPAADSDGDGVANTIDQQPFNPNVAASYFTPGENSFGTLAFEDLWPHKGDYDFNDLVMDYNFEEYLNAEGKFVGFTARFIIKGMLASMRNGFGLELGIDAQDVQAVTGGSYTRGYTQLEDNGVESRQPKAVIIVFEDAFVHYDPVNENTVISITVDFSRPVTRDELGFPPYNPFILSNGERGREVHLPGYSATSLVHLDYFGSVDDSSIPGTDSMYKTDTNQPWALHLPVSFDYPYDGIEIYKAYNYFAAWVDSYGLQYVDWYLDLTGYRDTAKLVPKGE